MSIAAMNWAWQQKLSPTPKLVLMALADAANDVGVCWPSVSTLASKCCVSIRTVRRVINILEDRRLMLSEPRYRKDGSCSSNRYRLQLEGGDRLSPAPDPVDTTPGHLCEGPRDASVIPGTTIRTQKEPLQPQRAVTDMVDHTAVEGGGDLSDLEYPETLVAAERDDAEKKLGGLPADLAQQLLDELTASIRSNSIRTTPLAYLRGLVARARAGTFMPEGALQVAEYRRRHAETDAAMRRNDANHRDRLSAEVDPDNPLVKKLIDIQSRFQEKERNTD